MMRFKVIKRKSSESRISYPCSKTSRNITFLGQPVKRQIHYSQWMRRLRWQRAQKLWNEKHQDGHLSSTKPRFLKLSPYRIFISQCMIIHHQRVPLPLWILFLLTSKSIIWGLHKLLTCWKCGLCIIAVIILQYQLSLTLTWARYWVSYSTCATTATAQRSLSASHLGVVIFILQKRNLSLKEER